MKKKGIKMCMHTWLYISSPWPTLWPYGGHHMGNNGLEGYYAKKCLFFLKFAQELLKNGEG